MPCFGASHSPWRLPPCFVEQHHNNRVYAVFMASSTVIFQLFFWYIYFTYIYIHTHISFNLDSVHIDIVQRLWHSTFFPADICLDFRGNWPEHDKPRVSVGQALGPWNRGRDADLSLQPRVPRMGLLDGWTIGKPFRGPLLFHTFLIPQCGHTGFLHS